MRAGSHVSTQGGYKMAAKRAMQIGASAFQYFPKNPRSLTIKTFDPTDAAKCAELCKANGIASITHSPYPTNIASEDAAHRERTALSLLNDLAIAEACGSLGVVVHFGVYKGEDALEGYKNAILTLSAVASQWNGKAKLLIENQAGDHTDMGMTIEELAQIRKLAQDPHKIGFCIDTCHLFASGVWRGERDAEWLDKARELHILEHIAAFHLNDSMYPTGERRDRHAVIGEGHIPREGFEWLLQHPDLADTPFIMETPAGKDGTHREQLALVHRIGGAS
ncbi:deoxyribonuclease-4 [Paenibacillus phyllosphaerae]|uniref:Deoxyribonuclease-4 n=1 Tax=Paenibacillus phyllosphaerae TaxID=274593 RepID=A0A7W5FMR6_9BACL|nr:deoxyribonuclease IV [Paenibacillus phyllosphaerae]MBB3110352.1 deoxyribonuclease-4 [Paenibacillus phyllosphaerae]